MTNTTGYRTEAEAALDNLLCNCPESCGGIAGVREASISDIARAISAAVKAEREACAKIAEGHASVDPATTDELHVIDQTVLEIAKQIRARNEVGESTSDAAEKKPAWTTITLVDASTIQGPVKQGLVKPRVLILGADGSEYEGY